MQTITSQVERSICVILVAEYSRYTLVILHRSKSEAVQHIKQDISRVKNQSWKWRKIIRSDSRPEYNYKGVKKLNVEEGIPAQCSVKSCKLYK